MLNIRKELDYSICTHNVDIRSINQLNVWRWLLNQEFDINDRIRNTMRIDQKPSCYVTYSNNYLVLMDFGTPFHGWSVYKAVCHLFIRPFPTNDEVRQNFQEILHFIISRPENVYVGEIPKFIKQTDYNINLKVRNKHWDYHSLSEWKDYGIDRKQLESDKVYPVHTYWMNTYANPDEFTSFTPQNMYDIPVGKGKKLYSMNPKKFITNQSNSLNGVHKTEIAYVCKFYKDYRVIANLNVSSFYTNGEHAFIPEEAIIRLVKEHKRIYVVRDNDYVGKSSAEKVCKHANETSKSDKFIPLFTEIAKDPSDVVKYHSYDTLKQELNL